jgi:hydroxymethylbilane synthase
VIAIECRDDDDDTWSCAVPLHDVPSGRAAAAERAFLSALGGGCNVPLGAFAEAQYRDMWLRVLVADPAGARILRGEARGTDPILVGGRLAEELLDKGARALLA